MPLHVSVQGNLPASLDDISFKDKFALLNYRYEVGFGILTVDGKTLSGIKKQNREYIGIIIGNMSLVSGKSSKATQAAHKFCIDCE